MLIGQLHVDEGYEHGDEFGADCDVIVLPRAAKRTRAELRGGDISQVHLDVDAIVRHAEGEYDDLNDTACFGDVVVKVGV